MKRSLKVLTLLLVVLLVGCSTKKNSANEKEALEAYVATVNKINEKGAYNVGIDGSFEVPKSAVSKTDVKGDIKFDGVINKDMTMDLDFDFKINEESAKMKLLSDSKYMYIGHKDQWQKSKLEAAVTDKVDLNKASTYEEAKKQFDSYDNKSYEKVTVDGKEGFKITYEMGLNSLTKEAEANGEIDDDQKEALKNLKGLKIKGEMFVPVEPADHLDQTIGFGMDIFGIKINFDADVKLSSSDNKKVVIPEKAKKAIEGNSNFNSLA